MPNEIKMLKAIPAVVGTAVIYYPDAAHEELKRVYVDYFDVYGNPLKLEVFSKEKDYKHALKTFEYYVRAYCSDNGLELWAY